MDMQFNWVFQAVSWVSHGHNAVSDRDRWRGHAVQWWRIWMYGNWFRCRCRWRRSCADTGWASCDRRSLAEMKGRAQVRGGGQEKWLQDTHLDRTVSEMHDNSALSPEPGVQMWKTWHGVTGCVSPTATGLDQMLDHVAFEVVEQLHFLIQRLVIVLDSHVGLTAFAIDKMYVSAKEIPRVKLFRRLKTAATARPLTSHSATWSIWLCRWTWRPCLRHTIDSQSRTCHCNRPISRSRTMAEQPDRSSHRRDKLWSVSVSRSINASVAHTSFQCPACTQRCSSESNQMP